MQQLRKLLQQLRLQTHQNFHQLNQTHHSSLQHNRSGVTLIEMMMTLVILSMSLTALFYTLTQTMNFARDSEMRIQAVALAREGIEAVYNIRNTNWLRFSSNRAQCWNVLNYDANCVSTTTGFSVLAGGRYYLYNEHGLWKL